MNTILLIALAAVAVMAVAALYVTEPRIRCAEGSAYMQSDGVERCVLMPAPSPLEGTEP